MKRLWIIIGLLLISMPTLGQSTAEPPIRVPVMVETAVLQTNDDGSLSIHVLGSRGTGCNLPIQIDQRVEGRRLIVELYEETQPTQACTAMLIGYDEVIPLDITPGETVPTVIVNGIEAVTDAGSDPATPEAPVSNDPNEVAPSRVETVIESVELIFSPVREVPNQGPTTPYYVLHINGHQSDQCDFPVIVDQSYVDGWLRIAIYREIPPTVRCRGGEVPYEAIIPLDTLFDYDHSVIEEVPYDRQVIEVNDQLFTLDLSGDTTVLEPTTAAVVEVEDVRIDTNDSGQTVFIVTGFAPNGCVLPIRGRIAVEDMTLVVAVEQPEPSVSLICPMTFRAWTYEVSIPLPDDLPADVYDYEVGDLKGEITIGGDVMGDAAAPSNSTLHGITDVQVLIMESSPPQVALQIEGYQPDGCESDVITDQRQDGNTFTIEIYRILPPDVMCPQVIVDYSATLQLGALDPGRYTFDVNGFIVTAEVQ